MQEDCQTRKWNKLKDFCVHIVMGINVGLVGILLVPMGILFMLIFFIWQITDKIVRLLEVKS